VKILGWLKMVRDNRGVKKGTKRGVYRKVYRKKLPRYILSPVSSSKYFCRDINMEREYGIISWFDLFQPRYPIQLLNPSVFGYFRWSTRGSSNKQEFISIKELF